MDLNLNDIFDNFDINVVASLWNLKIIDVNQLQDLSSYLLMKDCASNTLIDIMSCEECDTHKISHLFDKYLTDMDIKIEPCEFALRRVAKWVSERIVSNETSPVKGAVFLWNIAIESGCKNFHGLDTFIYAASEIGGRGENDDYFEEAIRREALRWIQ